MSMKKLMIHLMSLKMVPTDGGMRDALPVLQDPEKLSAIARESLNEAKHYIELVKACPDNHYSTDDEIAAAILSRVDEKKSKAKS